MKQLVAVTFIYELLPHCKNHVNINFDSIGTINQLGNTPNRKFSTIRIYFSLALTDGLPTQISNSNKKKARVLKANCLIKFLNFFTIKQWENHHFNSVMMKKVAAR
jgi:hypothetical protein